MTSVQAESVLYSLIRTELERQLLTGVAVGKTTSPAQVAERIAHRVAIGLQQRGLRLVRETADETAGTAGS